MKFSFTQDNRPDNRQSVKAINEINLIKPFKTQLESSHHALRGDSSAHQSLSLSLHVKALTSRGKARRTTRVYNFHSCNV